jgi:hypothetical protein
LASQKPVGNTVSNFAPLIGHLTQNDASCRTLRIGSMSSVVSGGSSRGALPAWLSDDSPFSREFCPLAASARPVNTEVTNVKMETIGWFKYWNTFTELNFLRKRTKCVSLQTKE